MDWIKAIQTPAERELLLPTTEYLKDAAARYKDRILKYGSSKKGNNHPFIMKASIRDKLLGIEEEYKELYKDIGEPISKIWALNGSTELANVFLMAGRDLDGLEFEHEKPLVKDLKRMAMEISESTGRYIEKAITRSLDAGLSIPEIANQIGSIVAFRPFRAVRIARTESTRALNRSSNQAYIQAKEEGINIRKQWLTADDDLVREAHRELEEKIIDVDEDFETDGEFGSGPGEFGAAGLDVNCRCTILPIILDD